MVAYCRSVENSRQTRPPAPFPQSDENLQSIPVLWSLGPRLDFTLNAASLPNAEVTIGVANTPPSPEVQFTTNIKF